MNGAKIDNIPVQLGDVVSGPSVGGFTNGRVRASHLMASTSISAGSVW